MLPLLLIAQPRVQVLQFKVRKLHAMFGWELRFENALDNSSKQSDKNWKTVTHNV